MFARKTVGLAGLKPAVITCQCLLCSEERQNGKRKPHACPLARHFVWRWPLALLRAEIRLVPSISALESYWQHSVKRRRDVEITPGVKMHFVSNQPYPPKDILCLARPSTRWVAFPASPNERAKFKTDAPKRLVEDVPFHLVTAASEEEGLKWSSNPLEWSRHLFLSFLGFRASLALGSEPPCRSSSPLPSS